MKEKGKEFVLPAISEVFSTDLHCAQGHFSEALPLSDNTVQQRMDDMTEDTENSLLCKMLVTGSSVSNWESQHNPA